MLVKEALKQIEEETGVEFTKSRFYHYDRLGLFPDFPRKDNGYRVISKQAYNHLKAIVVMTDLGFSLSVIKKLVFENEDVDYIKWRSNHILKNVEFLASIIN